jgi:Na+/H+ antiporter NhaA
MVLANTGVTSGLYHSFLETPVQLRVGALEINKNMLLWINDALMAVFFLLIGLEVKREMIQGRWPAVVRPFSRCGRLRRDDCPGAGLPGV